MKLKMIGVMTATALLGTVLATTSVAQPRGRGGFDGTPPPRGEMPGPARGGRAGPPRGGALAAAQPERFIERHDTDADGRVSAAEFVDDRMQHIDDQFERRDTNGDGVISLDEHEAPRGLPARAGRGPRPDADRPARPEIDREAVIACVRETIADFEPRFDDELEDIFAHVDTNGDGKLVLAEVSAAVEARAHDLFARIDDNGDGYIVESEVEAHFEAQLNVRRVTQACIKEQLEG